ncbi:endolytic transglycosylase MltG [Utexia brackfieldae]|uniref:endolytic transglycosylase MltG n=1 Tax=Utexia brackfieldae TaxID=3074108 RepID=UPI00370DC93B
MFTRLIKFVLFLAILIVIAITGAYYYLQHFAQQKIQLTANQQLFTVERGMSITRLAAQMQSQKLLENAKPLPYLLQFEPDLRHIKSGTYQLTPDMTVHDFLTLLNSGKEIQLSIQFVEGSRAKDWLIKLQSQPDIKKVLTDDLTLAQIAEEIGLKGQSLEGWLYPDTYHYTPNSTDLDILKRAYQRMNNELQTIWLTRDENLPYQSPYELLIMASIIEKETGLRDERSLVASVFVNRLKRKMKLQTDPTVIYGMGDRYDGNIRRRDLTDKNSYNTYVIDGLPPTPIAMPSKASLLAAAHPAQTSYLFFVADGRGGHVFSTNLNSHNQAVQAYLKIIRSQQAR